MAITTFDKQSCFFIIISNNVSSHLNPELINVINIIIEFFNVMFLDVEPTIIFATYREMLHGETVMIKGLVNASRRLIDANQIDSVHSADIWVFITVSTISYFNGIKSKADRFQEANHIFNYLNFESSSGIISSDDVKQWKNYHVVIH